MSDYFDVRAVRAARPFLRLPDGVDRTNPKEVLEFITRSSYPTAPDPLAAVAVVAAQIIQAMHDELHALADEARKPLPMILHCPNCHLQHIDRDDETGAWATTSVHRKHLCKKEDGGCGKLWMPANVATVGVESL